MTDALSLQELIDSIERTTPHDDPLDRLAAASTTAARLTEAGDALLDHYVGRCREAGNSWAQISGVLGVTKQAVHKRFGHAPAGQQQRWVPRARAALDKAAELAREHDHTYLGTEHLLLGLLSDPTALSARVLNAAGITYEQVSARIFDGTGAAVPLADDEEQSDTGLGEFLQTIRTATLTIEPPATPRARRALAMALAEALRLGHNYIGTEHLLLGLYHVPNGLAARVLTDAGLDLDTARVRVVAEIVSISERGRRTPGDPGDPGDHEDPATS